MFSYPLRFDPLLKIRVWGGERLSRLYDQKISEPIGESWEVCDHEKDISCIANGPARGRTLRELFAEDRSALVGSAYDPFRPDRFPLMLKLLDAKQDLSVQVHPDDRYADLQKPGELGKTEAWYILACEEGACIYRGLKKGTTRDDLRRAMESGTVDRVLKRISVNPGEVYYLPAGMVHALGAGVEIAEIQQNSDTTYRLFDWNRTGLDGLPRPLHLDDGLAVTAFDSTGPDCQTGELIPSPFCRRERFIRCKKFTLERLSDFRGPVSLTTAGESFHLLTAVDGRVTVTTEEGREELCTRQSCLLPASCRQYHLEGTSGSAVLLFFIEPGVTRS